MSGEKQEGSRASLTKVAGFETMNPDAAAAFALALRNVIDHLAKQSGLRGATLKRFDAALGAMHETTGTPEHTGACRLAALVGVQALNELCGNTPGARSSGKTEHDDGSKKR